MTLHLDIDSRHADAMGLVFSSPLERLRNLEMRGLMAALARRGRHDVVLRIVYRDESAFRARIMDRHNLAVLGAEA